MSAFKKKPDPIAARENALKDQIASLEEEIKQLEVQARETRDSGPRLRSTAVPHGPVVPAPPQPKPEEPIFEKVDHGRLEDRHEAASTADHYNELGVRKYDLPALLARIRDSFRTPAASNPKLVSYLAAGGLQGLRPLRYEKRVARRRFILFVSALFLTLLGILLVFLRH